MILVMKLRRFVILVGLAQTAKQVVMQRLREKRKIIYDKYKTCKTRLSLVKFHEKISVSHMLI